MTEKDKNYYCTLFDSNYLLRGYTMIMSLTKHDPKSYIFVFAFDDITYESLLKLKIDKTKIIHHSEFESQELLNVKAQRTIGEYCWTCTPWIIKYCLEEFNVNQCIYVDADLFFFDNPQILIDEATKASVLITEHRYSERYDQTKTSGKYCVQFLEFKNSENAKYILNWWAERCLEWCFAKFEDGKFGDQKYLDDWETRFEGVHSLNHLGGGVAPWNFEKYTLLKQENEKFFFLEEKSTTQFTLVFYHFHEIKLYDSYLDISIENYYLPPINFSVHLYYYSILKINFNILINNNIYSERYYDLTLNLLKNSYKQKETFLSFYKKQKRKFVLLYYISLIIGISILIIEFIYFNYLNI